MSAKSSFLQLVWSQGESMSDAIAAEVRAITRRAAEPVRPGDTVAAQIRRAWESLGRPPFWRVRAAWYGDRAGSWSAGAVADFQARYRALLARDARHAAAAEATTRAKSALPLSPIEAARADYATLAARVAALEDALGLRR